MKFTSSLSFQIAILFTIISMLSVIGAGTLSYLESQELIEQQFEKSMTDIATTISTSINSKADSAAAAILRVAGDDRLILENNEKIQEFLRIIVSSSTFFNNIYYFTPEGPIRAVAYADGRDLARYAQEDFNTYADSEKTLAVFENIVKARDTQLPIFSSFFKSAHDRLMNTFIVPVIRDGEVKGLLSCAIALDSSSKLLEMMDRLKPHPKGFVALVNGQGEIVLGAGGYPEKIASASESFGAVVTLKRHSGYLQAFSPMEKTGLGIVTGLPEDVVAGLLQKLRSETFAYTLGVGIFTSLLGFLSASFLVAPLSQLVDGLKKLKNGEKVSKINRQASGEIAEAILAFNDLNDKLRKEKTEN